MIKYMKKLCVKAKFSQSDTSALISAINKFKSDYQLSIRSALLPYQDDIRIVKERENDVIQWFEDSLQHEIFIEIITSQKAPSFTIFLSLKDMDILDSGWAKRFHHKNYAYLSIHIFRIDKTDDSVIDEAIKKLTKNLQVALKRKRPIKVDSISQVNETYEKLKKFPHHTPEISEINKNEIRLLSSAEYRNVLIKTRLAKDPTLENVAQSTGLSRQKINHILKNALSEKLVEKNLKIRCRNCRQPVAQVSSIEALESIVSQGAKCTKCNQQVTMQSKEDCFVVNDEIGNLINGSRWMGLYVRMALADLGVTGIRTEVIEGPNELVLIGNLDGELFLMELKASQFSIGHAYSFVGKCSIYKPKISAVIATDGIDDEVKEYVLSTGIEAYFIESLEDFSSKMEDVFAKYFALKLQEKSRNVPWGYLTTRAMVKYFDPNLTIEDTRRARIYR